MRSSSSTAVSWPCASEGSPYDREAKGRIDAGTDRRAPLLWDTTAEPSAFDPEDWFRYCEEVNGRPPPRPPAFGMQSVMPAHLDIAVKRYGAEVDDFTLADHPVATFSFAGLPVVLGISAKGSYAAGGLDEMIAMGVRRAIFLGGAATLVPESRSTRFRSDEGPSRRWRLAAL